MKPSNRGSTRKRRRTLSKRGQQAAPQGRDASWGTKFVLGPFSFPFKCGLAPAVSIPQKRLLCILLAACCLWPSPVPNRRRRLSTLHLQVHMSHLIGECIYSRSCPCLCLLEQFRPYTYYHMDQPSSSASSSMRPTEAIASGSRLVGVPVSGQLALLLLRLLLPLPG